MFSGGFFADYLIRKGCDRLTVRRMFYLLPRIYFALCGLALTMEPSVRVAILISISQQTVDGIAASGLWVNVLDKCAQAVFPSVRHQCSCCQSTACSPIRSIEYPAAIMGLMNCCANLTYCALIAATVCTAK